MNGGKLPEGWVETPLENIVEILDSMRIPVNNKARQKRIEGKDFNKLYPYYGATGEVGKIDDFIFDEELIALGEDGVPFFDGQKNKAYMLYGKTWVNNHAHVLKAIQGLSHNKFLCYFLNQFDYHDYVNGGTRLKLTQANMRKIPVRFAPFSEQKIIAEKLDTLLAQVDSTKARLEQIPQILKRFRQAVLAAAARGELTKDWYTDPNLVSAKSILNEIETERNQAKNNKLIKQGFGKYKDISPLFHVPSNSWEWVRLEQICATNNNALKAGPFGSALKKVDCVEVGYKVYGQEQVISGNESLETYRINDDKYEQLKSCTTGPGDILISLVGTIGKVLVLSSQAEIGIINPRLVKITLHNTISPQYIKTYLDSPVSHSFFKGFSHGGTMEILNLSILKELPIALPPLEEQHEIVRRVEQLFAYANTIEKQVNNALTRVNNLTQSILAKAFRGELTAQWRAENPSLISGENSATALLERIKAERAASSGKKSSRKKA
ncbi:TPA: restriction endonuclease subunit S [Klebsiella pneumoniae]|uniref:restriction endonuclease subunit S n=1 Tax=Klebsiella TaxID=570 RepID=UPI000E2C1AC3|nr:restriction endonuclease subunit S [Klebsiella pneumoniae]MCA5000807.1 restriction endonuclease subunit S [Klebsiella pneumoniae]MCC4916343.1 restriction endonuclease subunit S [Klebsiella pneumoniae]UZI50765.1 restriction endonuclease subunit S [Klebsiella pneumoniae]SVS95408.1 type I restriction-modification system [Klebsiella pneumoniae]HBW2256298.1 restriction endonuclease subunit S [Klebsiella pneumoniae]